MAKQSNNKIISCSSDKTIKVWDIASGDCLNTLEGHASEINCIDFEFWLKYMLLTISLLFKLNYKIIQYFNSLNWYIWLNNK